MISNSEKVEKKVQEAPKPVEKEETIADMANDKKKGIFGKSLERFTILRVILAQGPC